MTRRSLWGCYWLLTLSSKKGLPGGPRRTMRTLEVVASAMAKGRGGGRLWMWPVYSGMYGLRLGDG